MKKVVFINGSPNENGCVSTAMDEVIAVLNAGGVPTEKIWLGKKAVPDCMACMSCQKTGHCVFPDQVNELAEQIDDIAGIVVGSPVYYGGPLSSTGCFSAFRMQSSTASSARRSSPAAAAGPARPLNGSISIS